MVVSLRTALIIQEHGADVAVGIDITNGKYGFEIYSIVREKYRPHLTSKGVYDSEKIAEEKGKNILEQIKASNLDEKRKELSTILGKEGKVIQKIFDASKKIN